VDAAFAEFAADEVRQAQNIYDELQTLAEDEFGEGVLLPDGRAKPETRDMATAKSACVVE